MIDSAEILLNKFFQGTKVFNREGRFITICCSLFCMVGTLVLFVFYIKRDVFDIMVTFSG